MVSNKTCPKSTPFTPPQSAAVRRLDVAASSEFRTEIQIPELSGQPERLGLP